LLVEAKSAQLADMFGAVMYAAQQPGVSVVSMSWGIGEFASEANYDGVFQTPANHNGVTFVASSGDYGAPPSYPAISPNVLSVGGTNLQIDAGGNYQGEVGWGDSGGGISVYEAKPSYQSNVTQSATKRTNPDVAYNGDPNSGVPVYDSTPYQN